MDYGDYISYWQIDADDDGTYDYVEISDCDESATEIVIPSEIDGLPVTEIFYYALYDCTNLTSIEIPDSVTSIEDISFGGCTSLVSINVSEENENYSSFYGILYNKDKT